MVDKHTKRYLFEFFGHCSEDLCFSDVMSYLKQADSEDDYSYLSSAITNHFEGEQRQFLQFKVWSYQYD